MLIKLISCTNWLSNLIFSDIYANNMINREYNVQIWIKSLSTNKNNLEF